MSWPELITRIEEENEDLKIIAIADTTAKMSSSEMSGLMITFYNYPEKRAYQYINFHGKISVGDSQYFNIKHIYYMDWDAPEHHIIMDFNRMYRMLLTYAQRSKKLHKDWRARR